MRYFFGTISILLMFFFYKNNIAMFFLVYFALMLFPQSEKFIKKYLKIELVEFAMAIFLLIYGPLWIFCKNLLIFRHKVFLFFISVLQAIMKLFGQFKQRI